MDLIYFAVTNNDVFNYFASMGLNFTIFLAPIFGALALSRN